MSRHVLARRSFLRGAAASGAVSVALPVLDCMCDGHGTAFADGTPFPKIYGYVHWGNGARPETWVPAAEGLGDAWALSPSLMPLGDLKPYLTVISGTNMPTDEQHPQGSSRILTGTDYSPPREYARSTPGGPSLDQIIARGVGAGHPFRSIEVAIYQNVEKGEGLSTQYVSHNGPNSPNPPTFSPQQLFDRLFRGTAAPTGSAPVAGGTVAVDKRQKYRTSVLDVVLADLDRLKARAGATDRRRLDQHFEGIRDLEKRLAAMAPQPGAAAPPAPTCSAPPATTQGPGKTHADYEKVTQAMADLIAVALACGLTRVFTLQISGSRDWTSYENIGVAGNYHSLTHGGNFPQVLKVVQYMMTHDAMLLRRLRATSIGAGNLLDHALVLTTSEVSTGVDHRGNDWPILIAGRAGGALRGNQHLRAKGKHTLSIHLAILKILGVNAASFGEGAHLRVTEPLAGVAA